MVCFFLHTRSSLNFSDYILVSLAGKLDQVAENTMTLPMNRLAKFDTINEFIQGTSLQVSDKMPDFLIIDHQKQYGNSCRDLPAYRQNYFEITFEKFGGCTSKVDQFELPAAANRLTFISPNRLLTINHLKEPALPHSGFSIFFDMVFLSKLSTTQNLIKTLPFFNLERSPALHLSELDSAYLDRLLKQIHFEYTHFDSDSPEVILHYLNVLLIKAKKGNTPLSEHGTLIGREQQIYNEFTWLVKTHFLTMTTVTAYADKIHVSAKHLSETVKQMSGKPALGIIHSFRLNYAKSLLLQTSASISQIAYELNFENADYFSVFFKRLTGTSPLQFRISERTYRLTQRDQTTWLS